MNEIVKYYSLIIICYLIELYLFNLLQFLESIQPEIINFLLRLIMVLFTAGIIRTFVFQERKNFFLLFFSLSLINPFISSVALFILFGLLGIDIIIAKIIGDVFTSLLLFFVLKTFLNG